MDIKGFKDTIDWYNQNALVYKQAADKSFSIDDKEQLDDFIENLKKGRKVLDAGCGSGRDTNYLTQRGLGVIGLDLSSGLIKVAKESYPNIRFVVGNMTSLPFSNGVFDGIWCHASLLHLETVDEVKQALGEFHRVLKQGGLLHVLVKAQKGSEKTAVVSDKLSNHKRFFQYFTKTEIESILKDSGFKVNKSLQYNEAERNPNGRPEVEWIYTLSDKL